MESERLVFRSSFMTLWRWTTLLCAIVAAAVYVGGWLTGNTPTLPSTAAAALTVGGLFGLAVLVCPVYVFPHGVRCYNFWGLYQTVTWEEISTIQKRYVFGLPYLTVRPAAGGGPIWLPLYLSNMERFVTAVRDRAGDDHPLVAELERWHN
jgi:hypothetical protein